MFKKNKGDNDKRDANKDGATTSTSDSSDDPALPDELKPQELSKPDGLKKLPPSRMEPGAANQSLLRPKEGGKPRKKTGGCGCLTIAALLLLIPTGLITVALALSINQFEKEGFVQQRSTVVKVEQSPEDKTLFLGVSLSNEAPLTTVETAYVGADVILSGTYTESVFARGVAVHCTPGSIFEKDLEVYALSFHNEGKIAGELKGQIVRQKGLPQDSPNETEE
jgi:hypothetical protein